MKKLKFKPFDTSAEPTAENMEKLNSIRSLYYAHEESVLPAYKIAPEFYRSVGSVLMGLMLEDLELKYVQFERDDR